LLDIDARLLLDKFARIDLFDSDPSAVPYWNKLSRQVEPKQIISKHLVDLTGAIDAWTKSLAKFLSTTKPCEHTLCTFLSELHAPPPVFLMNRYHAMFSINILSQIPIFWRDRTIKLISTFWGIKPDGISIHLNQAIHMSMQRLLDGHLEGLDRSGAELLVLITDTEIYYYRRDQSSWQVETAVDFESFRWRNYFCTRQQSWLWHILPQGLEDADHGVIHRVEAYELRRDTMPSLRHLI